MRKPADIVYGVGDTPPAPITVLSALQYVAIMAVYLIFPLIICGEARASTADTIGVLSLAMLATAAATLLQVLRLRGIGSGYLCPEDFSGTYMPPSVAAAGMGGLPLVFGMTAFAGLAEAGLSRVLNRLRPYFPPEVAGLVILLVGISNAAVGVEYLRHSAQPGHAEGVALVAAATLGSMVALNIWTRGAIRMLCALIGIAVGYMTAALSGLLTAKDFALVGSAPVFALPRLEQIGWAFDVALVIPFLIGALASTLKAMAVLAICQRINDADWLRPDLENLRSGVAADGLGTFIAGALGTFGVSVSASCVGLSAATGITSRRVAYVIAAIFALGAFFPKAAAALAVMPKPVMAAALMFTACFLLINGIQTITSRMLDSRKTFIVGLTIIGALTVETFPQMADQLPEMLKPLVGSALVFGTVLAFVLNLVFRLGIRQKVSLLFDTTSGHVGELDDFLDANGARWGARRDIIDRAKFALHQAVEAIADHCAAAAPVRIEARFDEFNLDLDVAYRGDLLELPEQRPSDGEIRDTEDGLRRLAGFMLRKNADRARAEQTADTAALRFHFDH